jgi:transcriptional regulator of acetoin/glycerol metabolism
MEGQPQYPVGSRKNGPVAAINPRLFASWQRSALYGVPLDGVQSIFSGTYDDDSLFYECGREVLADIHSTISSEPVGLMLTNAEGLVLNRLTDDSQLIHALDAVNLAPGFSYSEREVGTNGLGLALADRVPSLVRAKEHYSLSLRTYTCAAAPIFDPISGRLEGAVNLTTWSDARADLLLALAQTAASSISNLMLSRSTGRHHKQMAQGQMFRVEVMRHEFRTNTVHNLSDAWNRAVASAAEALRKGHVVAAVGESGSGRSTLLAQAERSVYPTDRLLAVRAPAPRDAESWLSFWSPELSRLNTGFVLCDVDELPDAAATKLSSLLFDSRTNATGTARSLSALSFGDIPSSLAALVDTVVSVPTLRDRVNDILPLAHHFAFRARNRKVEITTAAARALTAYSWPGNVNELAGVIGDAAARSDSIDVRHLPPEMLSLGEHLPRIKAFERQELIRVLTIPGISIEDAAKELGMSRATVYRKVHQYGIQLPRP